MPLLLPPLPEGYYIPAITYRCEIEVLKSRFIATAGIAASTQETKSFLVGIRQEMPGADHHVYAFRIGFGKSVTEGMSDDGEPSGTAGPPVLAVVRGSDIGDLVIVVTRYFGGKKLGTGGLVRAYTDAAQEVLLGLPVKPKIERNLIGFECSYSFYERAKRMISLYSGTIEDETFSGNVSLIVSFISRDAALFSQALSEATAGQIEVVQL